MIDILNEINILDLVIISYDKKNSLFK
jgi:hypothetical protein